MLSLMTDWSKIRFIILVLFTINVLLASTVATGLTTSGKQKRQLFREHLSPEQGGKIPEAAFHPERILLNKYQQNGLYLPDGYHLLQRMSNRLFPHKQHPSSNTIKIHIAPDNRYVAPEGQIYTPLTVDTTYLIREPVKCTITPQFYHNYNYYPLLPYESLRILRKFKYSKINNSLLKDLSLSPDDYASHILLELSPYLRRLHETD